MNPYGDYKLKLEKESITEQTQITLQNWKKTDKTNSG